MPRRRSETVTRTALLELIREHFDRHLFVIVAPAGYGKTTFLVDFVHQSDLAACFYRVDPFDRDLKTFLLALVASINRVYPHFGARSYAAITEAPNLKGDLPSIMNAIVTDIDEFIEPLTLLIFDNFHEVNDSPEVAQALDLLLQYLPDHLRVFIATRRVPKIALSGHLVRQDVIGVSTKLLRFNGDEVREFVNSTYHLALTPHAAKSLSDKLHGWIAGINLTMIGRSSGRTLPDENFWPTDQSEQDIFDFLGKAVLAEEDPAIREFLLSVAVLPSMTPEACDELLQRNDSRQMLQHLERSGMFIDLVAADTKTHVVETPTYIFQDLFRKFLLVKAPAEFAERHTELRLRAGAMARARRDWSEAAEHYAAINRKDLLIEILNEFGDTAFDSGNWRALSEYLSLLGDPDYHHHPDLAHLHGRVQTQLGNASVAMTMFRRAVDEHLAGQNISSAARSMAGLAYVQRAYTSPREALATIQEVFRLDYGDDPDTVFDVQMQYGGVLAELDRLEEAAQEIKQVVVAARSRGNTQRVALGELFLAVIEGRLGNTAKSGMHYRECIDLWTIIGNSSRVAEARANLVENLRQRGEFNEATVVARRVVDDAGTLGLNRVHANALLGLGDVLRDTGKFAESAGCYEEGVHLARRAQRRFLIVYGLAQLGHVQRLLGLSFGEQNVRHAVQLAMQDGNEYEQQIAQSALAAVHIENGNHDTAIELLRRAIQSFDRQGAKLEAGAARIRLVRAAYESRHFRVATHAMRELAEMASTLTADAVLVTELSRNLQFTDYMLKRRIGLGWLENAMARLPQSPDDGGPTPPPTGTTRKVVEIRSFGGSEVRVDNTVIERRSWSGDQIKNLFFFLAVSENGRERGGILREFWPDSPSTKAVCSFQASLTRMRRVLYPECVSYEAGKYVIDPHAQTRVDLLEFKRLASVAARCNPREPRRVEAIRAALALYNGTFLPDVDMDWADAERDAIEQRAAAMMRELAATAYEAGDYAETAKWCERLTAIDPFDENTGFQHMRALTRLGDRLGARRVFRDLRNRLRRELQVEPDRRLVDFYDRLTRPRGLRMAE